jgi:hypothetical protein
MNTIENKTLVNKQQAEKILPPTGKTPWPAFFGRPLPALAPVFSNIHASKNDVWSSRQQISFGRKSGKTMWGVRLQGKWYFH